MTSRIDIHAPVFDLCERLGLTPEDVCRFEITPRSVAATVYKTSTNGTKYREPSPELLPSQDPDSDSTGFSTRWAVETRTFDVTT